VRVTRIVRSCASLAVLVLAAGCAASAPPPAAPVVTYEQKMAWILRLEDQRLLRDPQPPVEEPPPTTAARGAAVAPTAPDLVRLLADGEARIRRRAALAIGRVGLPEGIPPLIEVLASDAEPEVRQMAAFAIGLLDAATARPAGDPDAAAAAALRAVPPKRLGGSAILPGPTRSPT
jgi:hypothetical protein